MKTKILLPAMAAGFLIYSTAADVKAGSASVAAAAPIAPATPVTPVPSAPPAQMAPNAPAAPPAPAASVAPSPSMPGGINSNENYRHTNSVSWITNAPYGNPVSGYTNTSISPQH